MPEREVEIIRTVRILIFSLILGLASGSGSAAPPEAGALLRAIEEARLDPARAVAVEGVRVEVGLAVLRLEKGLLIPLTGSAGGAVQLVFLGKGRIEMKAPDSIEAGQLELFTGREELDEPFDRAVLHLGSEARLGSALKGPRGQPDASTLSEAEALRADWRTMREREMLRTDRGLLLAALGEPGAGEYFAALLRGGRRGDLLFQVDPMQREQVTLGAFVRYERTRKEERRLARELRREQRRGRLLGLDLDDLGQFDTWISAALRSPDGEAAPGTAPFEARRYSLDSRISAGDLKLRGKARIEIESARPGARAVPARINGDLKVNRVTGEDGAPLYFQQARGDLLILLPRPVPSGGRTTIVVEYEGGIVEKSFNVYRLLDTQEWYPHVGEADRATYDVTFRWPENLDLVACGRLTEEGAQGGERWARRTLERPSLGCSFEVGSFRRESRKLGHVQVDFAFGSGSALTGREVREEVIATVGDALQYYEEVFGPYPLDYLTVATAKRGFSQGLLGFVTLSDSLLDDLGMWNKLFGLEDRRVVIAHEVAHQWWGNTVGWESYRDQWLSEGMATYAALLYTRNRLGGKLRGTGALHDWQSELLDVQNDSRRLEGVGPVVLGARLLSSRSGSAYQTIVYKKGGLILDMMAAKLGEDAFHTALRTLVREGGTLSTRSFLDQVQRLTGTDLDPFARRHVYGTGMPRVHFRYAAERDPQGGHLLTGAVNQIAPYRYRYHVVRNAQGRLVLRREGVVEREAVATPVAVPLEIETGGRAKARVHEVERGTLEIGPKATRFRMPLRAEPVRLRMDTPRLTYRTYFDATRQAGRALLFEAGAELAAGDFAAAEALLRQAEEAPKPPNDEGLPVYLYKARQSVLQGDIDLTRIRLFLDQGRVRQAEEAFRRENEWGGSEESIALLRATLEIEKGEHDRAFRRLRAGWMETGPYSSVEGFALLAIAAHETGHTEELRKARRWAIHGGVDLGELER